MTAPLPLPEIILAAARQFPAIIPHLSESVRAALKIGPSYAGIRADYWLEIYDAVYGYLSGDSIVSSRNRAIRAIGHQFVEAAEVGYVSGGGELPMDDESQAWLAARQAAEIGFIEELFARLKAERKDLDPEAEALARADGYASTLDQVYSEAAAHGGRNKMLTFVGNDGKESCPTCKRMKGQRHRASWWIKHDLIPGSSKYECGGWRCEHILVDDQGNQVTL